MLTLVLLNSNIFKAYVVFYYMVVIIGSLIEDNSNISYFWPFKDLSVQDVFTQNRTNNSLPFVYANDNVSHLRFSSPLLMIFGTYKFNSSCFINLKKCAHGLTIKFWFQLVNEQPHNGNLNLITFSGDFFQPINVWVTMVNGQPVFNAEFQIELKERLKRFLRIIKFESTSIKFQKWYFVILKFDGINNSNKFATYLDNKKLNSITSKQVYGFNGSYTNVDLVIGPIITALESQSIFISTKIFLIWEKILNTRENYSIYLKEAETAFLSCKVFKVNVVEPYNTLKIYFAIDNRGSYALRYIESNCLQELKDRELFSGNKIDLFVTCTSATVIWHEGKSENTEKQLYYFKVNIFMIENSTLHKSYSTIASKLSYTAFKLVSNSFYQFEVEKIDQQTSASILYKRTILTEVAPCINEISNEVNKKEKEILDNSAEKKRKEKEIINKDRKKTIISKLDDIVLKMDETYGLEHAMKLLNAFEERIKIEVNLFNQLNISSKTIEMNKIVITLLKLNYYQSNIMLNGGFVEAPNELFVTGNRSNVLVMGYFYEIINMIGVLKGTQLRKKNASFTSLNSELMAVSIFPQRTESFKKPVVIVQKFKTFLDLTPNCVYLKYENGSVIWSDEGCFLHKFNSTHITCHCFHLTNFAILMSVTNNVALLSKTNAAIMNIITVSGIIISLFFLLLSFLTFLFVRSIQSIRTTIHKNVVASLFISQFIFLFVDRADNKIVCQVIGASLHYFFLVSFFMMGFEGVVLYLMLVKVFRVLNNSMGKCLKYIALCWALPILIVTLNLAIDIRAYGKNLNHCWLSVRNGFIWSFVGPVTLIISINFYIFIKTLLVVSSKSKKRSSNAALIWFWIKSTSLVLCILGITWIVGVFYIDSDTLFFGYIFTVVNSLQGFSIFVFHCLVDAKVRSAWRDLFGLEKTYPFLSRSNPTAVSPNQKYSIFLRKKRMSTNC
ncbi:adhesion G protein-coupled receptor E3 isoform X2 [Hydra vulgaris]|uniref:adhesion G protein-coupled receptor E3 isoform X2 n=1 Tax=Hydra vulgaris TaxID=6087 RepID=UPI0032EA8B57